MKVGIITIISRNYGNRLQNFALQYILRKNDIDVETIPISNYYSIKNKLKYIIKKIVRKDTIWENYDFNIKYAHKQCYKLNLENYDYFIAGSDQIWNPNFKFNSTREFLDFANGNQKISYAASIGVKKLTSDYYEKYCKLMQDIKCISVREETASEIVKDMVGRKATVVLDPVLLLEKEEWECIVKEKSKWTCDEKYIFKYFLGECDSQYKKYIEMLAKEKNYKIIDIFQSEFKNSVGPFEFVQLILGAEMVCTDSFHATAFSIDFSIPFIVFARPNQEGYGDMSARLESLLHMFKLEKRLLSDNIREEKCDFFECDFDFCKSQLLIEREKSLRFLTEALQIDTCKIRRTV